MKGTPFLLSAFACIMIANLQAAPRGLLLTWQRDPSSTMTIQWMEEGERLPVAPGQPEHAAPYTIAHLEVPKGNDPEDALWKNGFAIDFLATPERRRFPSAEFSAQSRLAWHRMGLVIGIKVHQKNFKEAEDTTKLWQGSSVELILSPEKEEGTPYHIAVAPGLDPIHTTIRTHLYSFDRKQTPDPPKPELKVTREDDGYRLLALIPWDALPDIAPGDGSELRLQIYVNQGQRPDARRLAWYPSGYSGPNPRLAHRVALGRVSSAPYRMTAKLEKTPEGGLCTLHALPEDAGKTVELKSGERTLGTATFQANTQDQIALARLPIPLPEPGRRWGALEIVFNGAMVGTIESNSHPSDYRVPQKVNLQYGAATDLNTGETQRQPSTVNTLSCWPGVFLHRVELTGLQPDTLYQFCPEGMGEPWTFRTMPQKLVRPLRIAIGGDTLHRQEWMEATTRTAVEHDPDFIIWGGDLADTNAQPEAVLRWQQWFTAIDRTLRTQSRRVIPLLVAIGNHDVKKGYYHQHEEYEPTDSWRRRLAPEFYELFAFPGQPGYGVLDFGDYLSVILLDSAHTNPIAGTQTAWLEKTLKERSGRAHLLPIYHIPAYPSVKDYHGRNETEVRKHWPPLFDRYRIPTAFEHHNHAYKRTHPITAEAVKTGGTVYLGDGAWGVAPRTGHDPAKTWYLEKVAAKRHAILLTLNGTRQDFKVFASDGTLLDEYQTPDATGKPLNDHLSIP